MSAARDDHAEDGANRRQHHALDQQLADNARARRADREAHGDLTLARGGARQQQVREVGAGDQQHEPGRRQQHDQRLAELFAQVRHIPRTRPAR